MELNRCKKCGAIQHRIGWRDDNQYHISCHNGCSHLSGKCVSDAEILWNYFNRDKVNPYVDKAPDWRPLEVDNLPGDILTGDYEFQELKTICGKAKYFNNTSIPPVEIVKWLTEGIEYKYRYRKRQPEKPTIGKVCAICEDPRLYSITLKVNSVEGVKIGEYFNLSIPPETHNEN